MTGRLTGRVIAVTRDGDPGDPLPAELAAAGAEVRSWPTLAFAAPEDPEPLAAALRRLDAFDWVVFTSGRAVDPVAGSRPWKAPGPKVAVVGEGTAARVRAHHWPVDVVGEGDGAAGLLRALARLGEMTGKRVFFPAGSLAGSALEEGLRRLGAEVERVEAYRTLVRAPDPTVLREELARGVHAVVFTSPSAVQGLAAALGGELASPLAACVAVAAGATTRGALNRAGVGMVVTAGSPAPAGLVDACVRALEGR